MTIPRTIPFLLLLSLCGCEGKDDGDAGSTTETSGSSADGGTGDAGTDAGDGGTGDGGDGDESSTGGTGGGPPVVGSLATSVSSITEDDTVTFTAEVTDPDGLDDIASGTLTSADESVTYGAFEAAGGGTFTIDLTWDELHQAEMIMFEGTGSRTFRASFLDNSGMEGSGTAELGLTCPGGTPGSCGDGTCIDMEMNDDHCGTCGAACVVGGGAFDHGHCESGACGPTYSECLDTEGISCNDACQMAGESCVEQGCGGLTSSMWDTGGACNSFSTPESDNTGACSDVFFILGPGNQYRCCCTQTP